MSNSDMRSFHPVETKEVASLSARWLTRLVIGGTALLLFTPFLSLYLRG